MNCRKNVAGRRTEQNRLADITYVSEGGDEALLVFHLQLVVLLVLPPAADIVEEGPDGCELCGREGGR